ncbi:MAG: glutamate-1-semialdehyde 2,1-aminomutase [Deltaproteobacteria bacterium]|nr:glutamate-1-semialdehyde 2,1-aminomutase [Deltaproteobacteria bacterium]
MTDIPWRAGKKSQELYARAIDLMPGGVNSPVRAFQAVGGEPFFVDRAEGPYVIDADGNRFIDFIGSWGPLILGHTPPDVVEAVCETAQRGTSFGAPHEAEVLLAEQIRAAMPSVELMRLVNSGTEATMSAIRLARAHTERSKIIKFVGCYHGHADPFLVKAGSGAATFGQPDSPGVTPATVADTLVADYNDLDSVAALFDEHGEDVAAVIVEPVAGNMGCVPPVDEFLAGLRTLCDKFDALLIFDEIITGFRVAPGGAQQLYGVTPDLTTLGKVVGGGLPVGAYGGKREIVEKISPVGPVYQAGTLSGNPLAVAAGLATLGRLRSDEGIYDELERLGARIEQILRDAAEEAGLDLTVNRVGSMMGMFFSKGPVTSWDTVVASDKQRFVRLFNGLLARGVSIAPSAFEALFVSAAHTDEVLDEAALAFRDAMKEAAE